MTDRKTILVVGCGAMGGLVAATLNPVARVIGYDINAAHVAAIQAEGLRIVGLQQRTERIETVADPSALSGIHIDAVVFLTKSKATAPALACLRPVLSGKPLLVTTQNGMGNAEVLLTAPGHPVARGVTMDAGRYVRPGVIEHLRQSRQTWIGPVRGAAQDVDWFCKLLTEAGMATELLDDPMGAVWSKFVFNSVMNPIGALLMGVNEARYASAEVRDLIDQMAAECKSVVEALGGRFDFDPMAYVQNVRAGLAPASKHGGSMALDLERGIATEIDELTGFIVREGERLNVPVATCKTVYRLVKGLEIAVAVRRRDVEAS